MMKNMDTFEKAECGTELFDPDLKKVCGGTYAEQIADLKFARSSGLLDYPQQVNVMNLHSFFAKYGVWISVPDHKVSGGDPVIYKVGGGMCGKRVTQQEAWDYVLREAKRQDMELINKAWFG